MWFCLGDKFNGSTSFDIRGQRDILKVNVEIIGDLISCLEVDCPSDFDEADGKRIDGARMVHVLRPDASIKSFRDYADKKVLPC